MVPSFQIQAQETQELLKGTVDKFSRGFSFKDRLIFIMIKNVEDYQIKFTQFPFFLFCINLKSLI